MGDGDCDGVRLEHGVADRETVPEALDDALDDALALPVGVGERVQLALGVDAAETDVDWELLVLGLSVRERD